MFERSNSIRAYTAVWFFVVIIVSWYFAFKLYPAVYREITEKVVILCFQVKVTENGKQNIYYYPNNQGNKAKHHDYLSDKDNLYFSGCTLLPMAQRSSCENYINWIAVPLKEIRCSNLMECEHDYWSFSESQQRKMIKRLKALTGEPMPRRDENLKITEPMGWGEAAEWPLFLILIFLGTKFGRTLGEFLFMPYEK